MKILMFLKESSVDLVVFGSDSEIHKINCFAKVFKFPTEVVPSVHFVLEIMITIFVVKRWCPYSKNIINKPFVEYNIFIKERDTFILV